LEKEIEHLTKELLSFNEEFLRHFQEARETGSEQNFDKVIKPFANKVNSINGEWKEEMKKWLINFPLKHIRIQQVDSVSEHIEQLSIQAFFPKTSKSRFLNAQRTVEFFLTEVLKEVNKEKRDA
jgi:hypothetical protein